MPIIRRGGEEIACNNTAMHGNCKAVHEHIKQAALIELDLEDNLLSLPHSTLVKIQYGGLIGLQQAMNNPSINNSYTKNIASLINDTLAEHGTSRQIPAKETNEAIQTYKLTRRRRK